jgi:tetraacyldisaccharide 4'-kinase
MPVLLSPLAWAYGAIAGRRMDAPPAYRARLPVICVGNLTAGGTGKTPFTHLVVQRLRAHGATPAIITRGHGGRTAGPHRVDARRDDADMVGDEALLHARLAPTIVSRDRPAGARFVEAMGGLTHIVLDDGLQNPSLEKTLRIVLIDAQRGLGNGAVIPAGPLRAPLSVQRRHIDLLVLNEGFTVANPPSLADAIDPLLLGRRVIRVRLEPKGDTASLRGAPVVAYAGIGVPGRFFRMLESLGADVRAARAFRDHQPFSDRDAHDLLMAADREGATLVTTAKDHVRLCALADGTRAELKRRSTVVDIHLVASAADVAVLDDALGLAVPL